MAKLELPVTRTKRVRNHDEMMPLIFFANKVQQAVWECILKNEIDSGFWSKVRFDKMRFLSAKTFVRSSEAGISFQPSQMSFYFDNIEFIRDEGYFIAVVMKLAKTYALNMDEMKMLADYVESFVMVDFKDDNSNYRRIQVSRMRIEDRNISEEYKDIFRQTEAYFKNKGIEMDHVVQTLKHEPITIKEIRKLLVEMSEIVKTKVDISDLVKSLKESLS